MLRRWRIVGGIVISIVIILGIYTLSQWVYAEMILPRQKAIFIPTSTTISVQAQPISVQCTRDADCELIAADWDYRLCDRPIFCFKDTKNIRAVNAEAWLTLSRAQGYYSPQTCSSELRAKYGLNDYRTTLTEDCMTGFIARAECHAKKCWAVQVLP